MSRRLSGARLRAARAAAQLLLTGTPMGEAAAVARVVAVQAQAPGPARLAVRARTAGTTAQTVDRACADGALVRTWAMRGTLHMLTAADVRWVVALLGPVFARAGRRRRDQLGLDERTCARAFTAIEKILAAGGPLPRADLIDRIRDHGVPIDPATQAPPHLLAYAANSGLICRGPDTEKAEPTYTLLDRWVPDAGRMDRDDALAELARRYITGYGPATAIDFASWSGLPVTDARRAFAEISSEMVEVRLDDAAMLAVPDTDLNPPGEVPVRLLGHFDALLLGYRSRDLILDPAHGRRVQAGGGFIQPTLLAGGRVAGTWSLERRGRRADAVVTPFGPLPPGCRDALADEADDLGRFLGQPVELVITDG